MRIPLQVVDTDGQYTLYPARPVDHYIGDEQGHVTFASMWGDRELSEAVVAAYNAALKNDDPSPITEALQEVLDLLYPIAARSWTAARPYGAEPDPQRLAREAIALLTPLVASGAEALVTAGHD